MWRAWHSMVSGTFAGGRARCALSALGDPTVVFSHTSRVRCGPPANPGVATNPSSERFLEPSLKAGSSMSGSYLYSCSVAQTLPVELLMSYFSTVVRLIHLQ